jgi:hypothetical protein
MQRMLMNDAKDTVAEDANSKDAEDSIADDADAQ